MGDEKDKEQLKKEAAEKAKAIAKKRLEEKRAAEQAEPKEALDPAEDLAKKKAAAAAKAKAAALAKMKAKEQEAKAEASLTEAPEEDDLAKKKAAAAAKAKAAALAKMKAKEQESGGEAAGDEDLAKKKAAAAAKAKAAAMAKQAGESGTDEEKAKAIAAAKAKAAAAAKAKAAAAAKASGAGGDDEKAKAIAAAKAKAAAAAKARSAAGAKAAAEPEAELQPSANQPYLDLYTKVIEEHLGGEVLEDTYINRLSKDVPTLVARQDTYFRIAEFLRYNEQLGFDYLSELHGTDFETHMEVYVHLYSYKNRQTVALKTKIDRSDPAIESLAPLWAGANWPECEAYDLLGISFKGHPGLYRIMLGEEWVGHPLRKDYEPYDVEV
ncbi:NADH-quinone oxidoreductase subunit C [Bacillus infantis]|uniref:NADH-quinone oxidoreductase subunit C n=1 Tax=Bacillus infantis TaxID=324767 RepID=A0A5D4R6B5_9BACI|nr:NADH-quinone oxidoreductase subunit C [Bacillus infantis]TYS46983.1 NADH-quinone oxidoreductase subunit C [Bacillus infantis]